MSSTSLRLTVLTLALTHASVAMAEEPCLFTPEQLKVATGRAYAAGEAMKDAAGQPLCAYAEVERPKRKLVVGLHTEKARPQFESRVRLLKMGKKIELEGVGDAAYFNGTAAGVLQGERFVSLTNLRRAGDPALEPTKVAQLLKAALREDVEEK